MSPLVLPGLLLALLLPSDAPPQSVVLRPPPAAARAEWVSALTRSLNVGRWWRYPRADTTAHLLDHVPASAIAAWRREEVRAIRLLVHPAMLLAAPMPGAAVRADRIVALRRDLIRVTSQGVRVVVALHLEPAADLDTPAWRAAYIRLWGALQDGLVDLPSSAVAYELASEPVAEGHEVAWGAWQATLAHAVRQREPSRLLVLNSARWSSLWTLEALPQITDSLMIVGIHYYDPSVVTHQGATWGGPRVEAALRNVPYPIASCVGASAATSDARTVLAAYCGSDPQRAMREHFARIGAWQQRTGVPVWLSEFGIIDAAPPATRQAWLQDVVRLASAHRLPWALFAWDEGFGIGTPDDRPSRPTDWVTWRALRP